MKLPAPLTNFKEWTLLGPMGPELPETLTGFPLLCVDGGARFTNKMDLWVGDGDSYLDLVNCEHIFKFASEKAQSDLALAFSIFHSEARLTLHAWGFLGGRLDHEMFNLGEALHFLKTSPFSVIHFYDSASGQKSLTCFASGTHNIQHTGLFSVAVLEVTQVELHGHCKYPLETPTEFLPLSSLGLSNYAEGSFRLNSSGPVMIFYPKAQP